MTTDSELNRSAAWPPEMVAKFGTSIMAVLAQVRRSRSLSEVDMIVAPFNLTPAEHDLVYAKMSTAVEATQVVRPRDVKIVAANKAKFYAACWYAGAAYRQIGRLLGVSHQTIHSSAGRVLGLNPKRVNENPVTDEQVAAFHRDWLNDPTRDTQGLVTSFMIILSEWSE